MGFRDDFGKSVMKARSKKKMKQEDLAKLLKTSQTSIWRIENGQSDVTAFVFLRLCSILEIDSSKFNNPKAR